MSKSQYLILQRTNDLVKKTKSIKENYYKLNENAFDVFHGYDFNEIVQLLNLKDDTKNKLLRNVKELKMYVQYYVRDNPFVIKYKYGDNLYKFVTNETGLTTIYKNNQFVKTYNLMNEFRTFNYLIMDQCYCLENYITLFVEDVEMRLGMHILAYYYPLKFKNTVADLETFLRKPNVRQFYIYFSNSGLSR